MWYTLGLSLDEIEKTVPPKYQRQLLAEMVSIYNTPYAPFFLCSFIIAFLIFGLFSLFGLKIIYRVVNSTLHRWVLRTATHGIDPDLVRYDPEQSMQFLRNWISSIRPKEESDLEIRNQFLSASFDVGEYLLYGGDFTSAENYLKKVKELHASDSFSSGYVRILSSFSSLPSPSTFPLPQPFSLPSVRVATHFDN